MNIHRGVAGEERLSIRFTGHWTDYAGIAITNLLLTVVTLGIYRFWAIARERSYLWDNTEVAGEPLEWTGTGKEMFFGFLIIAFLVLAPLYLATQWILPAMIANGQDLAAGVLGFFLYIATIVLGGIAMFRALRYRLSRTWWRGIRGGSHDPGLDYGVSTLGYGAVALLSLGLAYPWTQAKLWNKRWNAMEYGSVPIRTELRAGSFYARWLMLYALPFIALIGGIIGGLSLAGVADDTAETLGGGLVGLIIAAVLFGYIVFPLMLVAYHAKYLREAVAATTWGTVSPRLEARTMQWVGLWITNILLAVLTLGIGALFWRYRTWKFVVSHLEIDGTVDPEAIAQSRTEAPGDAEGLADAFDIGAF